MDTPVLRTVLPDDEVPFSGDSEHAEARRDVLMDQAAWEAWWADHTKLRSVQGGSAPAPPIDVDFTRELLVAVTAGVQPSSCGEHVRITDAHVTGGRIQVTVTTYAPADAGACTQARVHPTHVVALSPRAPVDLVEATAQGPPPPTA